MNRLLKLVVLLLLTSLAMSLSAATWPPSQAAVYCWRAGTPEMNQLVGSKKAVIVDGQLRCNGGFASAETVCAITQEMTIDISFVPERLTKIKARILDIASQWSIWQVNDQISIQIPGSKNMHLLATLPDVSPVQLILVVKGGSLKLFMYGLTTDIEFSTPPLNVAARSKITLASNKWKGAIYALAIYSVGLSEDQIAQSDMAMAEFMRQLSQFRERRIFIRATVTNLTPTPTPEAIAPYRHALIAFEYRVDEVLAGENVAIKSGVLIRVERWGILGGKQTAVKDSRIGDNGWLMLDPIDARPDLAEQYTVDKLPENFDLPYFIEIN